MTMPSNNGTTKPCAHDRAKSVASAARIPSAKPRASTGIRVAGSVTSDASTASPSCRPARAESAVPMEAGAAAGFMAHRQTATSMGASPRACGAYVHFDFTDLFFPFGSAGTVASRSELVGMFLFHGQDSLDHAARGRVLLTEVLDDAAVTVDGDSFRHQVFRDHACERIALDILRVAAADQSRRREIGRPAQLHDAFRDLVGVPLLFVRMVEKLLGDALRMDASRHEVMAPVAKDKGELGRQRIVQQLEHYFAIRGIARGDRAFVDVLSGPLAQRLDVGKKRVLQHGMLSIAWWILRAGDTGRAGRTTDLTSARFAVLVAGAMSMAAGEYVSVRSQADSEQAALNLEREPGGNA